MQSNKYKFIDGGGLVGQYSPSYLWWIMAHQDQQWKGIRSLWMLYCRTADLCTGMDGDLLRTGKSYFSYRLRELAFIVLSQMTRATLRKRFFFPPSISNTKYLEPCQKKKSSQARKEQMDFADVARSMSMSSNSCHRTYADNNCRKSCPILVFGMLLFIFNDYVICRHIRINTCLACFIT